MCRSSTSQLHLALRATGCQSRIFPSFFDLRFVVHPTGWFRLHTVHVVSHSQPVIRLRRLLTRLLRYNRCRESSWIGESLFPTVYSSSSYRSCILHVLFSHAAPSFESVFYTLLPTLDLLRLRTFSIFMNCTFSANRFSRWRLVHHHRQFFRYRLGLFVKQVYLVFVFDSFLSIVCSWTDRKLIFRARSRASVPATTTSELVATSVTSSPSNDKKLTKCLSRISIVTLFESTTTRMSATTSWSSIRWPSFLIFNSLVV